MSGNLQHVNETASCPHQGRASVLPAQSRVLAGGQPVATLADQWTVAGCVFTVGNKPQPCVTVRWTTPSARIRVNGSPVLLQSSTGVCQSVEQIPQGPPTITVIQQRVVGQ